MTTSCEHDVVEVDRKVVRCGKAGAHPYKVYQDDYEAAIVPCSYLFAVLGSATHSIDRCVCSPPMLCWRIDTVEDTLRPMLLLSDNF